MDDKTLFIVIYQDVTKSMPNTVHYTGLKEEPDVNGPQSFKKEERFLR